MPNEAEILDRFRNAARDYGWTEREIYEAERAATHNGEVTQESWDGWLWMYLQQAARNEHPFLAADPTNSSKGEQL